MTAGCDLPESTEIAPRRARLAEIDRELARLQGQHDLAMSAFQFDEANALLRRLAALEDERRNVVATLPPAPAHEPSPGGVPVLARPRRLPRRR
jgi:hypothetical protein